MNYIGAYHTKYEFSISMNYNSLTSSKVRGSNRHVIVCLRNPQCRCEVLFWLNGGLLIVCQGIVLIVLKLLEQYKLHTLA